MPAGVIDVGMLDGYAGCSQGEASCAVAVADSHRATGWDQDILEEAASLAGLVAGTEEIRVESLV